MQTVFSYVVQKSLSQKNEDVATDALAFILNSSKSARTGMMKLLCGIADCPRFGFGLSRLKMAYALICGAMMKSNRVLCRE